MVKKRFFMKVISVFMASALLCGCGIKNAGSADASPNANDAQNSDHALETVSVNDSKNADKAPEGGAAGVADQAEDKGYDSYYDEFYAPLIDTIYNSIITGEVDDNSPYIVPEGVTEAIMYDEVDNNLRNIGYRIEDISGDGIPELLIVDNTNFNDEMEYPFSVIYGIYTDYEGSEYMVVNGWTRSTYFWISDGRIAYGGTDDAFNSYYGIFRLCEDGTETEWEDFYFVNETDTDIKFYHNKEGVVDSESSEETDQKTYEDFEAKLWDINAQKIETTSFEDYAALPHERTFDSDMQSENIFYFKIKGEEHGIVDADFDNNGFSESVEFKMTQDDSAYYVDSLVLNFWGDDHEIPDIDKAYAFMQDGFDCFCFKTGGDKQYLYMQYVTDSDYNCCVVYSFDNDKFEYVGDVDGAVFFTKSYTEDDSEKVFPTDPTDFLVCKRDFMMGTQSYTEKCMLGDNGLPEPIEEYRYYLNTTEPYISAAKTIACYVLEDEDALDGEPGEIPKDAMITPFRTNCLTYIDLKVDDDSRIYRIMIEQNEDGMWELSYSEGMEGSLKLDDCFAGLLYAG